MDSKRIAGARPASPLPSIMLACSCATAGGHSDGADATLNALGEMGRPCFSALSPEEVKSRWPWPLDRVELTVLPSLPGCSGAHALDGQAGGAEVRFTYLPYRTQAGLCELRLDSVSVPYRSGELSEFRAKATEFFRLLLPEREFEKLLHDEHAPHTWKGPDQVEHLWIIAGEFLPDAYVDEYLAASVSQYKGAWALRLHIRPCRSPRDDL